MFTKDDVLYPLSFMRMTRGLPKLSYEEIDSSMLPEPYQNLLVHEGDMTSRLEGFHESAIRVRRLRSSNDGKNYYREVVLETVDDPKPTEYGAIEILLESLPEETRELVVEARLPLGGILNDYRIPYSSTPRAFLKVIPDEPIVEAFGSVEADEIFGRSNEITGFNGETIARIVEILPVL
jgi:chorismate-pyruvate lyase